MSVSKIAREFRELEYSSLIVCLFNLFLTSELLPSCNLGLLA